MPCVLYVPARIPVLGYAFTPANASCKLGTNYAGYGLPSSYNATTYGQSIWPLGKGAGYTGWVGATFLPTTKVITFTFTCDNAFELYVNNNVKVGSGSNFSIWHSFNVNTYVGLINYVSVKVIDSGGAFGLAGNVKDANGNILLKTSTSWVSQ